MEEKELLSWDDATLEQKVQYLFQRSTLQHQALTRFRRELNEVRIELDSLGLRAFQGVHSLDARVRVLENLAEEGGEAIALVEN